MLNINSTNNEYENKMKKLENIYLDRIALIVFPGINSTKYINLIKSIQNKNKILLLTVNEINQNFSEEFYIQYITENINDNFLIIEKVIKFTTNLGCKINIIFGDSQDDIFFDKFKLLAESFFNNC